MRKPKVNEAVQPVLGPPANNCPRPVFCETLAQVFCPKGEKTLMRKF